MDIKPVSSTAPVYTLSTTSELSGIPAHSIRQYIDRGLIIPFKKESGRNLFSQVDILRLKYIQKLLDEDGLNIAGISALFAHIPCWAMKKCDLENQKSCEAYKNSKYPCWLSSDKSGVCKNENCHECDVYKIVENYTGVKEFLKTLIR